MGQRGGTGIPAESSGDRTAKVVRFRSFEVDFRTGELRKGNRRVKLRDKSLEVLALLLEQPGQLVTRDELRVRLWPNDVFVDFENNINCAVSRLRYALGDSASRPRFIETLPRRGYRLLVSPAELSFAGEESASGRLKLLVLPFQYLGQETRHDYLSDGVTEEIIVRLATCGPEALRVIARATAMSYRGTSKSIGQIGRELGVDYIVEGRLFRAGNRLRLNASIVHVPDDSQIWATSRDGECDEILSLQREVADTIAGRIRALASAEQTVTPAASSRMTDPETYDTFLRGRFQYRQLTYEGLTGAVKHFRQCVATDPFYAPAWASLASALSLLGFWGYGPLSEVMPEAERSARKAIELDTRSALAHTALGTVSWFHHWDLDAAEKEYSRSVELSPGDSEIRWPLFVFLSTMRGDHDRAIREARMAEDLDPASVLICANVGWVYYWARRYDDAVAQSRRALEMSPDCLQAYYLRGASELAKNNFDEAIRAYEKAFSFYQDNYSLASLAMAVGASGAGRRAVELFEELHHRSERGYVPAMCFALACLGRADVDRVFEWLERAYADREAQLLFLKVTPAYDSLRADARFERLLERIGLSATA
ncbi:MAG: hypothetical protein EHM23_06030 [Acidobacteria bacterium]|nr:MAG: hypothetical protein EHM23_06030 [Acidobacteriota bacterium]